MILVWLSFLGVSRLYSIDELNIVNGQKILDEWQKEVEVSHATEVWISVLEWCESKGRGFEAINPKDLDGTPSYYHFQFKPGTIKHYGVKYGWLPDNLEEAEYLNWGADYVFMRNLVRKMTDDPEVEFDREFPWCVRDYGYPPSY